MPPRSRSAVPATVPTPTVGRIVLALVAPFFNNGSDVCPAVITRVWSESEGRWMVNYRLLMDAAAAPAQEWKTSAYLYADEELARAAMKAGPGVPTGMHAFWPPRA